MDVDMVPFNDVILEDQMLALVESKFPAASAPAPAPEYFRGPDELEEDD